MAKDNGKAADMDPQRLVRVKVKRAISVGGINYAPKVDGKKVTPTEATIPYERAIAHGSDDVEIIGEIETKEQKEA